MWVVLALNGRIPFEHSRTALPLVRDTDIDDIVLKSNWFGKLSLILATLASNDPMANLHIALEERDHKSPFPTLTDLLLTAPEEVSAAQLEAVAALPRTELLVSLRQCLRGALARYLDHGTRREGGSSDDDDTFALIGVNAMSLIGALGARALLPDLLDVLRIDEDCLTFFTGDFPNHYYHPALFALTKSDPEPLIDYLREAGNAGLDRAYAAEVLGQIALHDPDLRPRVIDVLIEFLGGFANQPDDAELPEEIFVGSLVDAALNLRAKTLLPILRRLLDRGLLPVLFCGGREEIEYEMAQPASPSEAYAYPEHPHEFFSLAFLERRQVPMTPDQFNSPLARLFRGELDEGPLFTPLDQQRTKQRDGPVRRAAKVGRNEPCPCGSGRKYKQCCLGK